MSCRLFVVLSLILFSIDLTAQDGGLVEVAASDSRLTYVGRTQVSGDKVSFDWTATYFRVSFRGTYLAMKASDTGLDYFDVWVDSDTGSEACRKLALKGDSKTYVLVDEADLVKIYGDDRAAIEGEHYLTVKKRTEGRQGRATIVSFSTNGKLLPAGRLKKRQFEVIGDSYSCGYGTESNNPNDPFTGETENSNYAYGAILARYFDADYVVVAHSGMGMARNYGGSSPESHMPDKYRMTFDSAATPEWNAFASDFHPQLSIVYLGTNDFSQNQHPTQEDFFDSYMVMLKQIKENYGSKHPVLCVSSRYSDLLSDFVRYVVRNCGLKNVYYAGFTNAIYAGDEVGAQQHPNYAGQRKLAIGLLPYVSTITGWPLRDDDIVR